MSANAKAGAERSRVSHPTGSTHKVFTERRTGSGLWLFYMTVASYNADGSFTGDDGKRYVEHLVLVQEDEPVF